MCGKWLALKCEKWLALKREKWLALKCALFAGMPGWVLMTSPLAANAHTHHLYLTLQRPTTQREQTMWNYKWICPDWQLCLSKLDNVSVKLAANVHHLYLNIQQAPHQREENREILNVSVHVRKSFCSKIFIKSLLSSTLCLS